MLTLLLDQGLPRSAVRLLGDFGVEAYHTGDIGLSDAADRTILDYAREHGQCVVTLDADFHAQLALSGAAGPSVIRIRIEGLSAPDLANLLVVVLEKCGDDLKSGALVPVTESGIRIRQLPLVRQ